MTKAVIEFCLRWLWVPPHTHIHTKGTSIIKVLLCKWPRVKISIEKGICNWIYELLIKGVQNRRFFSAEVVVWCNLSMESCGRALIGHSYCCVSVISCFLCWRRKRVLGSNRSGWKVCLPWCRFWTETETFRVICCTYFGLSYIQDTGFTTKIIMTTAMLNTQVRHAEVFLLDVLVLISSRITGHYFKMRYSGLIFLSWSTCSFQTLVLLKFRQIKVFIKLWIVCRANYRLNKKASCVCHVTIPTRHAFV